MKSFILAILTSLIRALSPRVLTVEIKSYGVLGTRVYLKDESLARYLNGLTGNVSLTIRHAKALADMGFKFQLPNYRPTDVPVWFAPFLTGANRMVTVSEQFRSGRLANLTCAPLLD